MTITIPTLSHFYLDEDKEIIRRAASLMATDKLIDTATAKIEAAIANNENADPDLESRIANMTEGAISIAPKSWAEQKADLHRQKRDVQYALDIMARKTRRADYEAGARLAKDIKPQHDIAAKELAAALVVAHEKHLAYWQTKRRLINDGIGLYGLFDSNVDDVLGIPVSHGAPLADYFRQAVKNGHLKSVPAQLR